MNSRQSADSNNPSGDSGKHGRAIKPTSATHTTPANESLTELSARSPAMRWEELQEALRNPDLNPKDKQSIAHQQLELALQHFSQRDERLARAYHCMARATVIEGEGDIWPVCELTRNAIRVYQQVERKSKVFNPERLAGELEITDLFRENIESSAIADVVADSFKNALAMLPQYIEQQKNSIASKFQSLEICQDAANFLLYHHEDPIGAISRAVRAACKIAGLPKPKNVETLDMEPGWYELPSAYAATIWGCMVEYYRALGKDFEDKVLDCAQNQVELLRDALQAQEKSPPTQLQPLYGDESTLTNEIRRSLVDALNTLGFEYDNHDQIDQAQSAYLEALNIPIPASGRYYRDSLEGLHSLADQYVELGALNEAAWIHDTLADKYFAFGRITLATEHVNTACKIYGYLKDDRRALSSVEEALLRISGDTDDPQTLAAQARLLWARDNIEQRISPDSESQSELRQENLKEIVSICRKYVFEDSPYIHLYAVTCLVEPLLEKRQFDEARPLLLEAFELLGGKEGQPEGFDEDEVSGALWSVGQMLIFHSKELAELGEVLLHRGIETLDSRDETTSKDYFPFLASLAQFSAQMERGQREGLEYVERALFLMPEPEEDNSGVAAIIVELMEVKSILLDQLGRYEDAAECNIEIALLRSRFDLEEEDEED